MLSKVKKSYAIPVIFILLGLLGLGLNQVLPKSTNPNIQVPVVISPSSNTVETEKTMQMKVYIPPSPNVSGTGLTTTTAPVVTITSPIGSSHLPSTPKPGKPFLGVNNTGSVSTNLPLYMSVGVDAVRVFALYQPNLVGFLTKLSAQNMHPLLILDEAAMVNGTLQYCHQSKHQTINTDQQVVQDFLQVYGSNYPGWFEFGNEVNTSPGNCGYTASQYVAGWNAVIPQLKAIAPNAWFGGPALPNTNSAYISTFLQQAHPTPDFISWHLYAGSYQWSTTQLQQQWSGWSGQIGQINNTVLSVLKHNLPLMITEWNYAWDGGVGHDPRVTPLSTSTFAANFAQQVLTQFQNASLYADFIFIDPGFASPVGTTTSDSSYGQVTSMGKLFAQF